MRAFLPPCAALLASVLAAALVAPAHAYTVYVTNEKDNTISVIDAATTGVLSSPVVAFGLFGIGVTPSGSHVYAASEDDNAVFVMATSTNTVTDRIAVNAGPAAFGLFFVSTSCDTSELEATLATVRAELASVRGALTSCQSSLANANARASQYAADNQALASEIDRLVSQLASSASLVDALVSVLFGERPVAEVVTAVRDVASAELQAARAVASQDPRLRPAQRAFDAGVTAITARDWKAALRNFRDAYTTARNIQTQAALPSGIKRR